MSSSGPVDGKSERRDARELFNDALELPSEQRLAFLDRQCAGDPALRARVARLLTVHDVCGDFLAAPTAVARPSVDARGGPARGGAGPGASAGPGDSVGANIGPYKLLERIGEGGFGSVYMAEQREPVQRRVALKIIKLGMDTRQVIARFEAERQALARMDHPNIARVLDAGTTDSGRPYFVMELVKGVPITRYCDEHRLATGARLALFADVCHAVQHAHQKGVIHRDIKPSNVIVSRYDDRPVVKIIDFGIAKAVAGRLTEQTLFTEMQQLIGTPAYMSPEQAGLSDLDIDTRSDIYSLGVLLYELLTGTTPFDAKTLLSAGYDEMRRIIREVEPEKPSTRVSKLRGAGTGSRDAGSGQRGPDDRLRGGAKPGFPLSDSSSAQDIAVYRQTDPPALVRLLHGDLDWIVMKCLEKDRTRRYETASDLAEDVQRHLSGEPVLAAPPSRIYRLRKVLRRYRVPVTFAATIALLLVGATAVSLRFWQQAEANATKAERQVEETELAATLLADIIGKTEPDEKPVPNEVMRQRLDGFAASFEPKLAGHPEVEARVRLALGNAYRAIGELNQAEPHQARALAIYRELYGPEHPKVATAMHEWAWLLHDKHDYTGAEATHREALAMRRRLLGAVHLDLSTSLDALGEVLWHRGDWAGSEAALRESLAIVEKLYGPEDREAVGTLEYLFTTLHDAGCLDEAEAVGRRALALDRKFCGKEPRRTAKMLRNLGATLASHGRADEGLAMMREGVEILERADPNGDPDLAYAQHHLAETLHAVGHTDEAEPLARRALDWYREAARTDPGAAPAYLAERACALCVLVTILIDQQKLADADTLLAELNDVVEQCSEASPRNAVAELARLGSCLRKRGKHAEALLKYEAALEASQRLFKDDHPDVATCLAEVAYCLQMSLNRPADALPKFEAVLAMRQRLFKGDHPDVAASLSNVAFCLNSLDRPEEALPKYRAALEMQQRLFEGDHADVATTLDNLAYCLDAAGQAEEALTNLEAALQMRQRLYKGDHPDVARNLNNVGWLLERMARPQEALPKYQAALEMRQRLFPGDHSLVALDLDNLARCLATLGRSDEAVEKYDAALEMNRRLLPPGDLGIADAIAPLALVLLDQQDFAKAESLLRDSLAIRREKLPPEHWLRFNTMSMLGGALAEHAQSPTLTREDRIAKLEEAEPLLLDGYAGVHAGLKDNAGVFPNIRNQRIHEALKRIVRLYDTWDQIAPDTGYAEKAAEWRARLDANNETATSGPAP